MFPQNISLFILLIKIHICNTYINEKLIFNYGFIIKNILFFVYLGVTPDISQSAFEDLNVVCGLVKSYFRTLPIPVITFDLYDQFITAVSKYLFFVFLFFLYLIEQRIVSLKQYFEEQYIYFFNIFFKDQNSWNNSFFKSNKLMLVLCF